MFSEISTILLPAVKILFVECDVLSNEVEADKCEETHEPTDSRDGEYSTLDR